MELSDGIAGSVGWIASRVVLQHEISGLGPFGCQSRRISRTLGRDSCGLCAAVPACWGRPEVFFFSREADRRSRLSAAPPSRAALVNKHLEQWPLALSRDAG